MKVMKVSVWVFVLSCIVFSVPAGAVIIKPDIVDMPTSSGGLFSFDFIIHDPCGVIARSFDTTISVSGPGTLTFDATAGEAVADNSTGNTNYWIYGNSLGADAKSVGGNEYSFGDTADNPTSETLYAGDIIAKYVFTWDGTAGNYTFSLDLTDTDKNSVLLSNWATEMLEFTPGEEDGGSNYFTVSIPEPATMLLFGLGGTILLRKRRA